MSTTPAVLEHSVTRVRSPDLLMWTLSFLAIPIAGYVGTAHRRPRRQPRFRADRRSVVGLPSARPSSGLTPSPPVLAWTIASAIGMSVGVAVGTPPSDTRLVGRTRA